MTSQFVFRNLQLLDPRFDEVRSRVRSVMTASSLNAARSVSASAAMSLAAVLGGPLLLLTEATMFLKACARRQGW